MKRGTLGILSLAAVLLPAALGSGGDGQPASPAPARTPATQPASRPAPGGTAGPAAAAVRSGRPNPFAPSEAAQDRLRVARPVAASRPAAGEALPALEGLLVKGKTVLACFRVGESVVVVEPGAVFACDAGEMTFVSCENELVVVKDPRGQLHKVRVRVRPLVSQARPTPIDGRPGGDF